jgi:signal transduction histidine kinase/CheY-like chemotaxis protein/HPt (histidine-containing phosphotransfer) domain-containing protein
VSIRWKVIILLMLVSALFAGTGHLIQRLVVRPSFSRLERDEAVKNLERCLDALERDEELLSVFCRDWAAWDDTYNFIADRNDAYRKQNLIVQTFTNNKLNILCLVERGAAGGANRLAWGEARDPGSEEPIDVGDFFAAVCRPGHPLTQITELDGHASGVYMTKAGPTLIASRPIVTSQNTGPVRGYLMMGRPLGADAVRGLMDRTRVPLNAWSIPASEVPAGADQAAAGEALAAAGGSPVIKDHDPASLHVYSVVRDVFGEPALLLRADVERSITAQGSVATAVATAGSVAGGAAILLVMWFTLRRIVVSPLLAVTRHAERVGAHDDLKARLGMRRADEIGTLAREFDRMVQSLAESRARQLESAHRATEAAEAATAAKSQFLAAMSHEIRTPLNGVVGMLELLGRTTLDDRQQHYARVAGTSAAALLSVINDVLDFSKIEAGRVELESIPFDVREVAEQVAQTFSPAAARKGLELGCVVNAAVPAKVVGDPERLRQVLSNLVNNAIKFTETGHVVLRVDAESPPTSLRCSVADTGVGIPPDRLDRLFKSFSQVDASTTRKYGGTGLGLVICKRLVEMMGGEIGVDSRPGAGTTFWFSLPLKPDAPPAEAPPAARPAVRVLTVGESQFATDLLAEQLAAWPARVERAATAADAPAILRAAAAAGEPFAALFVALGERHVAEPVKADPALAGARAPALIALAGIDDGTDRESLWRAGFVDCLIKPVPHSRLWHVMAAAADPAAAARSRGSRAAVTEQSAAAPLRVLVAEDNDINQLVVRELLTAAGHSCDVVDNGRLAVEAVAGNPGGYDVVLMDCRMPEMDGFEATAQIRAREGQAGGAGRLRIVALTADAQAGDRERCLAAGMDGYLCKPIDPRALLAALRPPESSPPGGINVSQVLVAAVSADAGVAPAGVPLDVRDLVARCGGNAEFLTGVLAKFARRMPADLERLGRSVADKDLAETARLAHGLKGVAATLSTPGLTRIAFEIEQLSRANELAAVEQSLARLKDEIDRCVAYIPTAVTELSRPGGGPETKPPPAPLIK